MEGDGKAWYFWKFYFRKQSGGTFPQRNLCLANILDGMIDQLRRGGRLVSAFNPFPGFIFYVLQYIVQPVNKIIFVLLDNIKAFQK